MAFSICVFCGSQLRLRSALSRGGDPARRAGRARRARVIYGGGHVGLMGAVADAAMAAGGEVVGLIPTRLLEREVGHRAITELIVTRDMFERKQQMIDRADAFVVLPGGLGTLDELLEVITLRQLGYHDKPIVLVNLGGYWDPFIALVDRVIEQQFARPSARTLYRVVDTVDEVLPALGIAQPPRAAAAGRRRRTELTDRSARRAASRRVASAAVGDRLRPAPAAVACACCWRRRNSVTKSIGSISSGGKPPSRVASATIRRANGNSRRGHSISSSGCRLSCGMLSSAEHAAIGQLDHERGLAARLRLDVQLQRHLVALGFRAAERGRRPGSGSRAGAWPGSRLAGARGFSNDRSLTYWLWIISRGALAWSRGG